MAVAQGDLAPFNWTDGYTQVGKTAQKAHLSEVMVAINNLQAQAGVTVTSWTTYHSNGAPKANIGTYPAPSTLTDAAIHSNLITDLRTRFESVLGYFENHVLAGNQAWTKSSLLQEANGRTDYQKTIAQIKADATSLGPEAEPVQEIKRALDLLTTLFVKSGFTIFQNAGVTQFWLVPANVFEVNVELRNGAPGSGGGGGGGGNIGSSKGGGGGSGGTGVVGDEFAFTLPVTPGQILEIYVGRGGQGGQGGSPGVDTSTNPYTQGNGGDGGNGQLGEFSSVNGIIGGTLGTVGTGGKGGKIGGYLIGGNGGDGGSPNGAGGGGGAGRNIQAGGGGAGGGTAVNGNGGDGGANLNSGGLLPGGDGKDGTNGQSIQNAPGGGGGAGGGAGGKGGIGAQFNYPGVGTLVGGDGGNGSGASFIGVGAGGDGGNGSQPDNRGKNGGGGASGRVIISWGST